MIKTVQDYIDFIWNDESAEGLRTCPPPERMAEMRESDWSAHVEAWPGFDAMQRLIILKFIGYSRERQAFKSLYDLRPKDVSWRQLVKMNFEEKYRQALFDRIDIRNPVD